LFMMTGVMLFASINPSTSATDIPVETSSTML
jgi:hypothetical protein